MTNPPGHALAERFFTEVVGPLFEREAPDLPYAAGLLGPGSEVLGLDDARSTDHDYGCRLTVLVDDEHAGRVGPLHALLASELPERFDGFPVRYPKTRDPEPRHRVVLTTVSGFARRLLGLDPTDLSPVDWLCLTGQSVLELTGGPVFHDATQAYGPLREQLAWYPTDVWCYAVASGWRQVGERLPVVGRAGERGDEVGSRIATARVAARLEHLAFLLARTWSPYEKWAGTALRSLPGGPEVAAHLEVALAAPTWPEREAGLVAAAERLADAQRATGLPTPERATIPFFDRPFRTVDLRLADDVFALVDDPVVRRLPLGVGTFEQWCDVGELLSFPERRRAAYVALLA